ncbi:MAG: SAM-dependent methyltransferase, partial [Mycobacteriales bacterium]
GYLHECARVLAPAGTLVVTTPNRLTFSPHDAAPLNPFHTRELTAAELVDAVSAAGFVVTRLLGVAHGGRLRRWERRHGSIVAAQIATTAGAWPSRLRRVVGGVRAADFEVVARNVDAALDLVVVAYRRP